jgi:hypothetical protein
MPAQSFHVLHPGKGRGPASRLGSAAAGASRLGSAAAGASRLGSAAAGAWFVVEPGDQALDTPFWAPFPWKALHRFAGT